jgi:hypothetical protein
MKYAPPPRFITPRDYDAPTEGRQIARVARLLGKPLMPWQSQVAYGATEKTALVGPVQIHRIMTRPNISAFFTAQTGQDAGERMKDLLRLVSGSPIAPLFKTTLAAGKQGVSLANRSFLRTFANPDNLHGTTPHLVTLDEIWKHNDVRGAEFMGAIGPAQATLEGESQLWMISTMGTSRSGMMNELIERGRAGHPGMFYAEWSMADGLDAYEPQTWWTFHPALGNTISESYLVKESNDQPLGEWMRAYMNKLTQSSDPLVTPEVLEQLRKSAPLEIPARSSLAITAADSLLGATS